MSNVDRGAVIYCFERTGQADEIRERLLTQSCPSCGASWSDRGSVRPHGSHRSFECVACGVIHEAQREEGPATHEG